MTILNAVRDETNTAENVWEKQQHLFTVRCLHVNTHCMLYARLAV